MAIRENQRMKKVAQIVVESCGKTSVSKAMKQAGYAEASTHNPQNITRSKSWKELLELHMPDSKLTSRHEELIDSENEMVAKSAIELAYKLKHKLTERIDLGNKDDKPFETKEVTHENVDEILQQLLLHAKSVSKNKGGK